MTFKFLKLKSMNAIKESNTTSNNNWSTTLQLPILKMTFGIPLQPHQIPQFRGAIVRLLGREQDLFHNHQKGKGYHYRFPTIQYRVEGGQAVLIAFGATANEQAQLLLQKVGQEIKLRDQRYTLHLHHFQQETFELRSIQEMKSYQVFNYLALNHDNFKKWQAANNLKDRISLLERILAAHLFAFGAGLGWTIEKPLEVSIQEIRKVKMVRCFGNPVMSFNLSYQTNLLLPPDIALGRVTSHGFGVQKPLDLSGNKWMKTLEKELNSIH